MTNELVTKNVVLRNEIELGIVIPTIKSRVSKISRDKGNCIQIIVVHDMVVQPIKIFVECVGVIMDILVPLMVIDWRGFLIMSARSRTRRVTHLTFGTTRVALG